MIWYPEGEDRTFLCEKLSDIREAVPEEEDLVFNHGDYCLPNVMFKGRQTERLHRPGLRGNRRPVHGFRVCELDDTAGTWAKNGSPRSSRPMVSSIPTRRKWGPGRTCSNLFFDE